MYVVVVYFVHTKCVNCNLNHGFCWWNWIPVFISFSLHISFILYLRSLADEYGKNSRQNIQKCTTHTHTNIHALSYLRCFSCFPFSFDSFHLFYTVNVWWAKPLKSISLKRKWSSLAIFSAIEKRFTLRCSWSEWKSK